MDKNFRKSRVMLVSAAALSKVRAKSYKLLTDKTAPKKLLAG